MKLLAFLISLFLTALCQNDADIESVEENVFPPSGVLPKEGEGVRDHPIYEDSSEFYRDLPTHVQAKLLFTEPSSIDPLDLPTNTKISILISLLNEENSPSPIYIERTEASIRYPQDTTFYIQNFTSQRYYERTSVPYHLLTLKDFTYVGIGKRAIFQYSFTPSEQLAGRPFTLVVSSIYRDSNNSQYEKAVFNRTLVFTELETGLDGQTFFLYLLMAGCLVLLILFFQNFITSWGKKKLASSTSSSSSGSHSKSHNLQHIEMGTQSGLEGVDLDWLPNETLKQLNKQKLASLSQKITKRPVATSTNSSGRK